MSKKFALFLITILIIVLNSCSNPALNEKVATPIFDKPSGTYIEQVIVTISCTTEGSTIYYTTNGSDPTTSSNLYNGPITITNTTKLKAIAVKSGMSNSDIATIDYNIVHGKVVTPTFDKQEGEYTDSVVVSINCSTQGAIIYYTLDGSNPTTSSDIYLEPITITQSSTLKAIAVKSGMQDSDVNSVNYIILQGKVASPIFNNQSGVYNNIFYLTITCNTTGAKIYYTTDGSDPNSSSKLYSAPIEINKNTIVKAIALKEGMEISNIAIVNFTFKVATPKFSLEHGTYNDEITITITSDTIGSTIYYTTDGTDPTTSSNQYNNPITLKSSSTLKAIAIKDDMEISDIKIAEYILKVSTPIFNLEEGIYNDEKEVTITCNTQDAMIYYTLDGTDPDTSSNQYSGTITITSSSTLKAIAYKNNLTPSNIKTANYTLKVSSPVFDIAEGTYNDYITVTLNCETPDFTIYYTKDGSDPTTSSILYTGPILVNTSMTIKAIAIKNNMDPSDIVSKTYNLKVSKPFITPNGGIYNDYVTGVTIGCDTPGVTIYYTTNGTTPTTASTKYTGPITVSSSINLKAIAVKTGMINSDVVSEPFTLKVLAPRFTPNGGIYNSSISVTIECDTSGVTIYYTTNGTDPTTSSTKYTAPINVTSTINLKAIAVKTGMVNSDISMVSYSLYIQHCWTNIFGSANNELANKIAKDSNGNIYITGYTAGTFNDGGTNNGLNDIFVSKYNSNGVHIWTRIFGSVAEDRASSIVIDDGFIYITGYTANTFNDGGVNNGSNDIFIVKYDTDGNHAWTKIFGSNKSDIANSIAIDSSYIYVIGYTAGTFNSGGTNNGSNDIFITVYDTDGNHVWTKVFGSTAADYSNSIAIDSSGNIFLAGYTAGSFNGASIIGGNDIFITKYDNNGNHIWTKIIGSTTNDYGTCIALDNLGNIYITGYTAGTFNGGGANKGSNDIFISKYHDDGNDATHIWTRLFGSNTSDIGYGLLINDEDIYITGYTTGSFNGVINNNAGTNEIFIIKYEQIAG